MNIPKTMSAMVLEEPKKPLIEREVTVPQPGPGEILIKVRACGVCRTDLHIVDGELPEPKLPLVPGHEIVGTVVARGVGSDRFRIGERVGVPWLGRTDGTCPYCRRGMENLCDNALFTGYTIDGGYAEYATACESYSFRLPEYCADINAAPLLCAGFIGYRSYRMATRDPGTERIGIYGFGAAAHIIAQVARFQGKEIFAFTRPGDAEAQNFALRLGAAWAGGSDQDPPQALDAAIIFAPVGPLVPAALRSTTKGGVVVCAGIHMSEIPSFPYSILWEERALQSVANLTRQDGEEFLEISPQVPVRTEVIPFALEEANLALERLRSGEIEGAAVLVVR
ncbi:MAG: zinc-dependent alcohol dehydrogenase family protein [Methanothrix sp.]|jgi:propanol-preferring alcohol dehydrogenase|uniref:Alcohol dehydrogenase GroES domain protein n=1 Tax=Methanothrix harundinacea TaxID=301375 RepID=A0A124G3C8_9EURY|nr:MAG: Alcohol dehydrogenase GroES domain protein [Methanothrix harundinacea]MDD2637549.1 zinc-dependent alcohol dehydrogenase family protein [Methanothrix sp.]KUK96492.1 MAG: Alcohol dehydrogenase GroES domain protein [Methanothrix harundinacea]MCP1392363.1 zinc-dependent alcohol dehydrogenase family protein [Methanothrix harundinacea]MDD3709555.1 zinc-dependent alcohol dehydrogenase family protein [Methanothrix sp.]